MRCVCSRQVFHALLARVLQPLDKVAAPPRASLLSRTNRGSTTLPATRGSTALLPSPSHASAWAVGQPLRRRHLGLSGHLANHARGRPLPQPHGQLHHEPPDHQTKVPQRRREPDGRGHPLAAAVASFSHVPEVRTSVLAPVGTFRANKDLETPPSTPPASPTPHDFDRYDRGPGPYPTVSDDVRISEAYKLAPQTLFKGPAGRELRRQMNRANPRGRRGPSLRPFDRDTKPGGCRSVEGQQKTQERLNWLKAPAIESSTDASVIWAAADARLPKEEPPRLEATAPVAKDLPMVKATQSVITDDAASWLSGARAEGVRRALRGQAPAPAPGEELSTHHSAITRTSNQFTHICRSHSAGADDHERGRSKGARHASFCTARGV